MLMIGIQALTKIIEHPYVELTSRGNAAIFYALYLAKKAGKTKVFIPDQGGWFTFKTYPAILGMHVEVLKTDEGILNQKTIPLSSDAVLLYAQPAGYFAAQDMESIYKQCNEKTVVIVDVSGSIGDKEVCDGQYADIMVGSFSEWKPINIGYGGFLSAKERKWLESGKEILSTNKVHPSLPDELQKRLTGISERYTFFYKTAERVKKDLSSYNILRPDKKGINVVVAYHNEKEKKGIIEYCNNHKFEYTLCPRYIRVKRPAVSIEIKRL